MMKSILASIVLVAIAAWAGYTYGTRHGFAPPPAPAGSTAETLKARTGGTAGTGARSLQTTGGKGQVLTVKPGQSIQDAVRKAQPGDTVQVMPGTYAETVYIDKDDIALVGVIHGGDWPILDGGR
ncbi:MAG: cytochrome-c peroxidase, partial [Proteobacteria bacterium]|nr:cytochrome-c peroxidase [Pseudomonadota bacterium]